MKFLSLLFFLLVLISYAYCQETDFLLLENLTEKDQRSGIFVAPPNVYKIRIKGDNEYSPTHMLLKYDDLFEGLDKTLKLKATSHGFYEAELKLNPTPSAPDDSGKDTENFYPRDFHFKRLEFKTVECSEAGWINPEAVDVSIWNKCLVKERFRDGWIIQAKNDGGETLLFVRNQRDLEQIIGQKIKLPFTNLIYLPDSPPSGSIPYKNGWLFPCIVGFMKSYFWAPNFAFAYYHLREKGHIQFKNISLEETFAPSIDLNIDVKVTPLSEQLIKISTDPSAWRPLPELEEVQLVWNDKEIHLGEDEMLLIKKGEGPLKIRWKMKDDFMAIQPLLVSLNLFRPNKNGKTPVDSLGEYQFRDRYPPQTTWEDGNWQEWSVPENEFKYVGNHKKAGDGFRSGMYQLKILATNFAANSIDKTFTFQVLGEAPEIAISRVERTSAEGLEFFFSKLSLNSRFSVQVATSMVGPFHSLSQEVEIFDINKPYLANLLKIRDVTLTRHLPSQIYFIFRALDAVENEFVSKPIEVTLNKHDTEAPFITVEQKEGDGIRIYDFGPTPMITGTIKDKSPWGEKNICQIYLDYNEIPLSSATLLVGNNLTGWSLTIPESMRPFLKNDIYSCTVRAIDLDGNESVLPLNLRVDILPFDLKISTPYYSRSYEIEQGNKKVSFIDFSAQVKENSFLSLWIDRKPIFQDLYTMGQREIMDSFLNSPGFNSGRHRAKAILKRDDEKKEVDFDFIIDNTSPQLKFVKSETQELLTNPEAGANFISSSTPTFYIEGKDTQSPVTLFYGLSHSIEEVEKDLRTESKKIIENKLQINLPSDVIFYLGILVKDSAGNPSAFHIYPLIYDTLPEAMPIQSVEQNSLDRQNLWLYFGSKESKIMPVYYDISVSTSELGPWKPLTLKNKIIPVSYTIEQIKTALEIYNFPGKEKGELYFKVITQDPAGNVWNGPAQKFYFLVDRRAPLIQIKNPEFHIIDFDPQGGSLYGKIEDEPKENSPVHLQLLKNKKVLAETDTTERLGGEFVLSFNQEAKNYLANGTQTLTVVAQDSDANKTILPVKATVDVKPFQIEIGDSLTQKLIQTFDHSFGAIAFDFPILPNSQISLRVAGHELFKDLEVGATQQFKQTVPLQFNFSEGSYAATLRIKKNGDILSKLFTLKLSHQSSNTKATPFLFVQGASGIIPIYDVGIYGGLSGTIKGQQEEPSLAQIYLSKEGVILATATVRLEKDILVPWDLIIPESRLKNLGIGEQNFTLIAREENGNESQVAIRALIDIKDPFIEIADPYFARSDLIYNRNKKSGLRLKATVKENSELSLTIDGNNWIKAIPTGGKRDFEEHLETEFALEEGPHKAMLTLRRNTIIVQKEFMLLIDNRPPKITLGEELPSYTNKQNLIFNGKVQSKTPVASFLISISSGSEKLNSILIHKEFDAAIGSFIVTLSNVPENTEKPYQLELLAKTVNDLEAVYSSYFFVDRTVPSPPTLKVGGSTDEAFYLEGTSDPDFNQTIVVMDQNKNILGKSPVYFYPGDKRGTWNRKFENLSHRDYTLFVYAEDTAGNRSPIVGPERITSSKNIASSLQHSSKDLLVENQWDLRFSPNGDGINDALLFKSEDLPILIRPLRQKKIIKTVTEEDNNRWDGKLENGIPCDTDLYLAKTKSGRELIISLYR